MVDEERRTHVRVKLERPCKLFLPSVGRYVSGSTWNLSAGGVLVQLDLPTGIAPGDRLFVGIALKRCQAVLPASEMLEAQVIRVERPADDRISVAARFVDVAVADDSLISYAA
ncbi:MAG: PilZ domain-containing protein [Planctomycetota bacterium]|jgi:hypothetical protein